MNLDSFIIVQFDFVLFCYSYNYSNYGILAETIGSSSDDPAKSDERKGRLIWSQSPTRKHVPDIKAELCLRAAWNQLSSKQPEHFYTDLLLLNIMIKTACCVSAMQLIMRLRVTCLYLYADLSVIWKYVDVCENA